MVNRRVRHLNPASAGAILVEDSRYISGLTDGSSISTWSDRSGNGYDATQSGAARPVYKVGIQGGQPVVRFNGTSSNLSLDTFVASIGLRTSNYTIITLASQADTSGTYALFCASQTAGFARSYLLTFDNGPPVILLQRHNGTNSDNATQTAAAAFYVIDAQYDGSHVSVSLNGAAYTTSASTHTPASLNSVRVGACNQASLGFFHNGDIGQNILFSSAIGAPLRARIRQAGAFAFKLPTS